MAEQLAEKKYVISLLEDLVGEKKAIESYLRHHHSGVGKTKRILTDMPEYQELLAPKFIPKSQELNSWMNASYEKNVKHPDSLIHKGSLGNLVRSKSEAIIDVFLYMYKIPFRYECALQLGDISREGVFLIYNCVQCKYGGMKDT